MAEDNNNEVIDKLNQMERKLDAMTKNHPINRTDSEPQDATQDARDADTD
ncbi:MAG: hypothetical protein J6X70_04475 [Muribaculaceae bacterium]|nr:hypothetical protein [Muribaculaceae bacterium]